MEKKHIELLTLLGPIEYLKETIGVFDINYAEDETIEVGVKFKVRNPLYTTQIFIVKEKMLKKFDVEIVVTRGEKAKWFSHSIKQIEKENILSEISKITRIPFGKPNPIKDESLSNRQMDLVVDMITMDLIEKGFTTKEDTSQYMKTEQGIKDIQKYLTLLNAS